MPSDTFPLLPPHLSDEEVEQYRAHTLPSEVLLSLSDHIALCKACRRRLSLALSLEGIMNSLSESFQNSVEEPQDHLDEAMKIAFVENRLSSIEQEMAECHFEVCSDCRFQVKELKALHTLMAAAPQIVYAPAPPPSFGKRFLTWSKVSAVRQTVQIGGFSFVTAFLVFLFMRNVSNPSTKRPSETQISALAQKLKQKETEIANREDTLQKRGVTLNEREAHARKAKEEIIQVKASLNQEKKRLTQSQSKPAFLLPEKVKLTTLSPVSGILIHPFSGSSPTKDPLPFALLSPLPGQVVHPTRVMFQWQVMRSIGEKSQGYLVELTHGTMTEESEFLTSPEWEPKKNLEPGTDYTWKVFVVTADSERKSLYLSPERGIKIGFHTLSRAQMVQLRKSGDSPLHLGVSLAQVGMWKEAEQTFAASLLVSPDDTRTRKWLLQIRQQRKDWLQTATKQLEQFPNSQGAQKMRERIEALQSER